MRLRVDVTKLARFAEPMSWLRILGGRSLRSQSKEVVSWRDFLVRAEFLGLVQWVSGNGGRGYWTLTERGLFAVANAVSEKKGKRRTNGTTRVASEGASVF